MRGVNRVRARTERSRASMLSIAARRNLWRSKGSRAKAFASAIADSPSSATEVSAPPFSRIARWIDRLRRA